MTVTAYTAHDAGMDGRGITASGEKVQEGRTIAADKGIPFGTQIYIPALDHTYAVTDRGGAIKGNRLDLYMESRKDALRFGVQELKVLVFCREPMKSADEVWFFGAWEFSEGCRMEAIEASLQLKLIKIVTGWKEGYPLFKDSNKGGN
jgi:3D (Asp-Asp-Asp) domain-containing protein